jgi:hypothetical protein
MTAREWDALWPRSNRLAKDHHRCLGGFLGRRLGFLLLFSIILCRSVRSISLHTSTSVSWCYCFPWPGPECRRACTAEETTRTVLDRSHPGTSLSTVSAYFCMASCWVILPRSFHAVLRGRASPKEFI